jgi:hypothetical protein
MGRYTPPAYFRRLGIKHPKEQSPYDRGCNPLHHGYMLNDKGEKLLCMWADCERPGHNKFHIDVIGPEPSFTITHFIFCTHEHKSLFAASHFKMGSYHPGM